MSTARQYAANSPSSGGNRNGIITAIQISWKQLRPDLSGDKDALREERLIWITDFLKMSRPLQSIKALDNKQLGLVIDELRRLTGTPKVSAKTEVAKVVTMPNAGAEIIHLSSREQLYAFDILLKFVGWTKEKKESYLKPRWRVTTERMLTHAQSNAFMMQLLNIAAHKDLKAQLEPKTKITRTMTAKHIPVLKKKLGIDQKEKPNV